MNPKISLIVPMTTRSDHKDLIKLVRSVASQTYDNLEMIIVPSHHNTSLDFSYDWLHLLPPPSSPGASRARNYGAANSTGEILGFLDDDVVLDSMWCEEAAKSFGDRDVGGVSGRAEVMLDTWYLQYIPNSLMWVVGGCYWNSEKLIPVKGAAGMNFAVNREAFEKVGGYNESIGPFGDRPEIQDWRRIGAEETDLALRIFKICNKKILYNPLMKVSHRVRPNFLRPLALIKRAMHVGRNRAYIHMQFGSISTQSDLMALKDLVKEIIYTKSYSSKGILMWKRGSFSIFILYGTCIGYIYGILAQRSSIFEDLSQPRLSPISQPPA